MAAKTPYQNPDVSLNVISGDGGYEIQCISDCIRESGDKESQVDDVICQIIEVHSGAITKDCIEEGEKCHGRISVFIPTGH